MPELPELEIAATNLRRWLGGKTIEKAEAEKTRIFRGSDPAAFERDLLGQRLEWIERRGKILLLGFTGGIGLLSHLGMTGKWVRRPKVGPAPKHDRARLFLSGDEVVHYVDPRLFGRIATLPADTLFELPEVKALGPDPLVDGVDPELLYERLRRTRRAVKVALMDQRVLAGIGNIQAAEALFRVGIHPARLANSLTRDEVVGLGEGILSSIHFTLEQEGAEEEITYVEEPGGPNPFLVYARAGEACPRCGTTLETMTLGGRASVFCPTCQSV